MEALKSHKLIPEFLRYLVVGGIAFIVDFYTLLIFKEFVFKDFYSSLYISTALGFIFGLAVNYLLSLHYVFNSAKDTAVGRSLNDIVIFIIIGIIGLILSEVFMFIGSDRFGFNYLLVKVGVTSLVLIWNFIARKILIFK